MYLMTPLVVMLYAASAIGSDEVPGAAQREKIVLTGAKIFPISSEPIRNGVVVFDEGRIVAVGTAEEIKIPKDAKQIQCKGKHIYPGLFEAYSQLGLHEIGAVRASNDKSEVGRLNPNVKAHVAVNPDSELIPVTRSNGVLLALVSPSGGRIAGQASVMQLDGWTTEDMTLRPSVAMRASFPSVNRQIDDGGKSDPLDSLRDYFDEARRYLKARDEEVPGAVADLRLLALKPVLEGEMPLLIGANSLSVIQAAIAFIDQQKIRGIIYGGYDAPACADLLKRHNVPVIVPAVYELPRRRYEQFDAAYTLPERLRKAGVKFCISGSGSSRIWNTRNLPYHAATAVAYGLPHQEALRSITLSPAEILGVADRVGSLESGKDATLIVTTGDPLETTSQVTAAWIQGRRVSLSNRHTRLYKKYQAKYRQLKAAEE